MTACGSVTKNIVRNLSNMNKNSPQKPIKLAIVMDPLDSINIKKDSTYAMIKEASHRNWQIFVCTPHDLYVDHSIPYGRFAEISYTASGSNWYLSFRFS